MSETLAGTPAADGFHMPAEWAEHDGYWMIWPERPDNWRLGGKPAQEAFAAVAAAIAGGGDPVTMAVSERQFDHARDVLPPEVRVVEMTTDDAWMRDVGPSFVVDDKGGRRGVDWIFNAWGSTEGGLYWPWGHDARVARKVLEIEQAGRYGAPLVLEAGSVHVDGEGTVLTTEECLLNHNRNPSLTREQIEEHLRAYLGALEGAVARRRHRERRDRRAHRQHRLLHSAGRRRAAVVRRRVRPAARDLAGCARAPPAA